MSGVRGEVHLADNLTVLRALPAGAIDLCYVDPPFNTGRTQRRRRLRTIPDPAGDRQGFAGLRYRTEQLGSQAYADRFDDYLGFLEPRLREVHRVLAPHGSLYLHTDPRESHYVKVLLDGIFGRDAFLNEIVWAYDWGGRPRDRWPGKHDVILFYARTPGRHRFHPDAIDRVPYLAPHLVTPQKAARGKLPTDTWWIQIVNTNSRERTGYPTQKPLELLRRIVAASSRPDDLVLDCFAGSGTTGAACLELGRRFVLVDDHPPAVAAMAARFGTRPELRWHGAAVPQPAAEGRR